jgi:recombination protein RecA
VRWWNHDRLHGAIGHLPPIEHEALYYRGHGQPKEVAETQPPRPPSNPGHFRLLLCRPDSGEQALQVASLLIESGSVDALAIDSIAALVPQAELDGKIGERFAGVQANLLSQALRKLAGQIARANTAVLVTNQLRQRTGTPGQQVYTAGGRALGYYASVRLHLHQPHTVSDRDRIIGARVRAQVVKNKLAPRGRPASWTCMPTTG